MSVVNNLRRIITDLHRRLLENSYDVERANERLVELKRERDEIVEAIGKIETELKRLEGSSTSDDQSTIDR